ncbi:MAG TPA: DUF6516 family protein [Rhodoblastus sp.]|nr:DUF6516 family protein [Rhodoblastus sp.]
MKAVLLLDERHVVAETAFVEIRIWRVPRPVAGSAHAFKYSLALVVSGLCVLRYDYEAGKGDHKHIGDRQIDYTFTTAENLLGDFWNDVDTWRAT